MNNVTDNAAKHRYELNVDGHIAFVEYQFSPGVIDLVHTIVPKELGGRGIRPHLPQGVPRRVRPPRAGPRRIGSILAKGVLDSVRSRDLKVIATCPFIAGYIGKNPDYADLLAK